LDALIPLQSVEPPAPRNPTWDARWYLATDHGERVAECSLWWRETPFLDGKRVGLIGHYAARDMAAAQRLIGHACEELRIRGCTLAIAPMDGNTWQRYRFIVDRGQEPLFFLEPDNPDEWPIHFLGQGFGPIAEYFSIIEYDLGRRDPRLAGVAKRAAARGIQIRTLNPQRMDDELRRIYTVSGASFKHNFLYTPISETAFIEQYRPIFPRMRPELILLAERDEQPVGFVFAIPDYLQASRGETLDTVIIKTLAILPERSIAGLGALLVADCEENARDLGYTRAVHALMHTGNSSRNIGKQHSRLMRRYALFAKRLS